MISKNYLFNFRDEINKIDKKIIQLLSKRQLIAITIAKEKISTAQPIRDIEREKNLLKIVLKLAKTYNLNINFINKIFKLIIDNSVSIQKTVLKNISITKKNNIPTVSFLGPKGSYSYIAMHKYAKKHFKEFQENQCDNFKNIIKFTEEKKHHYAILPIENTSSGAIDEVYNLLNNTTLSIIDEINLPINHCLLSLSGTSLKNIKKIYSHPQPFQQCSQFIDQFPNWKIKYTSSSAEAMKKIFEMQKNNVAALGSDMGSQIYNLQILLRNISNRQYNITRFIILSHQFIQSIKLLFGKITVSFITEKKSDDLINIIEILQKNNLMMKQLHSKPLYQAPQKKIFYIDILMSLKSLSIKDLLSQLSQINKSLKILGYYKSNTLI